jgi:hypothetical protein
MGWAWHKLYPQTTGFFPECPADFICPSCQGEPECSGTICYGYCPNGQGICQLETCIEVDGSDCSWTIYPLPGVDRYSRLGGSGRPSLSQELGLLYCTSPNALTDVNGDPRQINPCDYEKNSAGNAYYYASPSSPTSPPAVIRKQPYAMAPGGQVSVPSRFQVISGFNRYRYTGYMAHGANCADEYSMVRVATRGANPEHAQNLMVGSLPTTPSGNIPYGVTGISGMENSFGRQFPLPDHVLTLPLFGGYTAQYRVLPTCTEGETEPDPAWSVGHYAPNPFGTTGAQKGSFSFQCYNAHSYYNDNTSYEGRAIGIPTCSVSSLLHAIYYKIHADMFETYGGSFDPANINSKIRPDWWKTVDPTGISADGTQMVRWVMNRFAEGVAAQGTDNPTDGGLGANFLFPNIFLWDEPLFTPATTEDRWKHLFLIGNANILQDSSCSGHHGYSIDADPPCERHPARHHFTLDECSHGSTGTIRLHSGTPQTNANFIGYGYQPHRARYLIVPGCNPNGSPCYGRNPGFESQGGHTGNIVTPDGFSPGANASIGRLRCTPYPQTNFCLQTLAFPGNLDLPELRKLCPDITTYFGHLDVNGVPKQGCDPSKN